MTHWTYQEVDIAYIDGNVRIKGLVYEGCPALAVTPLLNFGRDPYGDKWKITHIPTGRSIGWRLWNSIDDAKRFLLALAPLTDWATITEANQPSFRKRLSPVVASISDLLAEAAEDDD